MKNIKKLKTTDLKYLNFIFLGHNSVMLIVNLLKQQLNFLTNIIQYPNSKFYKNLISSKQKFYDFLYCKKFWEEHQNILKKNNPFIKTHNTLFYKEECFTNLDPNFDMSFKSLKLLLPGNSPI